MSFVKHYLSEKDNPLESIMRAGNIPYIPEKEVEAFMENVSNERRKKNIELFKKASPISWFLYENEIIFIFILPTILIGLAFITILTFSRTSSNLWVLWGLLFAIGSIYSIKLWKSSYEIHEFLETGTRWCKEDYFSFGEQDVSQMPYVLDLYNITSHANKISYSVHHHSDSPVRFLSINLDLDYSDTDLNFRPEYFWGDDSFFFDYWEKSIHQIETKVVVD